MTLPPEAPVGSVVIAGRVLVTPGHLTAPESVQGWTLAVAVGTEPQRIDVLGGGTITAFEGAQVWVPQYHETTTEEL